MSKFHATRGAQLRRTTLALALGLGLAGGAMAQSTAGSIFGNAPAAAGGTVTVVSNSGVSRTVNVDSSGRYNIAALPIGTYTVTLKRDGQSVGSRSDVTIVVGAGTEVSFGGASAKNAQNLQGLTVTANSLPAIDVSSVDSRTVITSQQLRQLPLARSAEAIALLAPGTVGGSGYFQSSAGNSLVSFGGASVTENAYYINGMNVTDPLQGFGGIQLPYGSIEQQEVLTGGYGAAYGRSDGGVISQIGKRGTNEWHFGAQVLWTPQALKPNSKSIYYPAASPRAGDLYQYRAPNKGWTTVESVYAGGPLIEDRLFMFVSLEGSKSKDTVVGNNTSSATVAERTFHDPKAYVKVDWNINDSNILELTGASSKHDFAAQNYQYNYGNFSKGGLVNNATSTKSSARMWIAKYTGYITDSLTITAQYGKQKTDLYSALGDNFDPNLIYILGSDQQNPAITGGNAISNNQTIFTVDDPSHQTRGANYRFDVTYQLGDHKLTAGIDNQRTLDLNDGTFIPTDAAFAYEYARQKPATSEISEGAVSAPVGYPGGAEGYYVDVYRFKSAASVRVEQRAQYIQDDWQVSDRWLLSLGLRNDQFTNFNSDGDPYIRQTKPQWAPRLGASWDVLGDSTFKVYANAGRYYLALPTSVALRGASGSLFTRAYNTYTGIDPATGYPTGLTPIDTINGPGVPYSENAEYGQAPDPRTVTSKSLKAQYQDEYIAGFDKQFNSDLTYGVRLTYRSIKTIIDDTCNREVLVAAADAQGLDTTNLRGCYFLNPGSGATFQLPDGAGGYGQLKLTKNQLGLPEPKRNYYSATFKVDHPFDGTWQGHAEYTYSKSYGNSEGQVKSDIGQDDIAATQDWDYPTLMEYAGGLLSNDRRHQFKAYGTYQFTPEWNFSAVVNVASGTPYSCLGLYGPDQTTPAYAGPYYHWCNGVPAPTGQAGNLPWTKTLSLNTEYRPAFANHNLAFNVNINNVFNEQKEVRIYQRNTSVYKRNLQYEAPRYVRFGISYDF